MVLYLRRNLIILVHFKRAANDALDQPLFSQNSNVFGMFEGKKKKKTPPEQSKEKPECSTRICHISYTQQQQQQQALTGNVVKTTANKPETVSPISQLGGRISATKDFFRVVFLSRTPNLPGPGVPYATHHHLRARARERNVQSIPTATRHIGPID